MIKKSALALLILATMTLLGCSSDLGANQHDEATETTSTQSQPLWYGTTTTLWTSNSNLVPMCWDQFLDCTGTPNPPGSGQLCGDPSPPPTTDVNEINAEKVFVAGAITEGWENYLGIRVSWTDCPTSVSDPQTNVRVKLVLENAGPNGSTGTYGMDTLSSAAQRAAADVPGLRVGFPAYWNSSDTSRAQFRSVLLHEFGHILGFGHEQDRPDADPHDGCSSQFISPTGYTLGPIDLTSIMGLGYCSGALDHLSPGDIQAARTVYGTSNTKFGTVNVASTAFCTSDQDCHLGDVNGDGKADIVAFGHGTSTTSQVWVGLSNGSAFSSAAQWSSGFCTLNQTCELGDVNGDGRDDLIAFARGASPWVWVSLSTGTGFSTPVVWSTFTCQTGENCKVADVNGDHKKDIVVFANSQIWIALSTGTGFAYPAEWSAYFCPSPEQCDVGDVDGDGKADAISFVRSIGQVWIGLSSGTAIGAPQQASDYFCVSSNEVCKVADVDGDGRSDLVSFTHDAATEIWVGRASRYSPRFLSPMLWHSAFCTSGQTCLLGDVSGPLVAGRAADAVALSGSPSNTIWVANAVP